MSKLISSLIKELIIPSPLYQYKWADEYALQEALGTEHQLFCKRDDLIHQTISGNKWRKLQAIASLLSKSPPSNVVSFGGGYSNHLHALAYLCFKLNVPFTAIVRGNYEQTKTHMIKDIESYNAQVKYVNKIEYRARNDDSYLRQIKLSYKDALIIPEGGSSKFCFEGMADLLSEIANQLVDYSSTEKNHKTSHNYIILPVASAGTIAGLINALDMQERKKLRELQHRDVVLTDQLTCKNTTIIGVAVLKGQGYLENLTTNLLKNVNYSGNVDWKIEHGYHNGGYAKTNKNLERFIEQFNSENVIQSNKAQPCGSHNNLSLSQKIIKVEHVYSGKVFYALADMLKAKRFQSNSRIIVIHTGGLQGAR